MNSGIHFKDKKKLTAIFNQYLNRGTVILYGSRAKGTYTERSDVDLVIKNTSINRQQLMDMIHAIEESDFPYLCDIQLFETINNSQLKAHIQRVGKILYP